MLSCESLCCDTLALDNNLTAAFLLEGLQPTFCAAENGLPLSALPLVVARSSGFHSGTGA